MSLLDRLQEIKHQTAEKIEQADAAELETVQNSVLGKKGELTGILKGLKDLPAEERKEAGSLANIIRTELAKLIEKRKEVLQTLALKQRIEKEQYDVLMPVRIPSGALHPLTKVQYEVEDIFMSMGFVVMDGPEVETDANNFGNLNFSDDHPARDMQDTFWTENGNLLRTHTSSVQVRAMEKLDPPFRIIAPGRVYRYEQTDASHENTFYQLEGMLIDEDVSVAHLIHVMKSFLKSYFEKEVTVRLRPGYFPFVEPGFELDFQCLLCHGEGCPVCKHSGWVELLPCGLVHPEVLKAGGIDPQKYNGFAFGMGLSRLVMMRYGIEDIRHFLSGNVRFLNQFH